MISIMPEYNQALIEGKERIAKLFKGKKGAQGENKRIPPGQVLTTKFPILDLGVKPDFNRETWRLKVYGLVEKELSLSYDDVLKMPAVGVTADFHCLAPGTFVFTREGGKHIEDIQVGDQVIGRDGLPHIVEKLWREKHDGFLLKIKATYLPNVSMTPDHKVLAIRGHSGVGKTKSKRRQMTFKNNPEAEWIEARYLNVGDYVFFPKYQFTSHGKIVRWKNHSFMVNQSLASVLGWYVAEGSSGDSKGRVIRFPLNLSQTEESSVLREKLEVVLEANVSTYQQRNMNIVTITSSKINDLSPMLKEWCGTDAFSKKIPDFILNSENEILSAFLQALVQGDGYRPWLLNNPRSPFSKSDFVDVSTASKLLAHQLVLALSKLGIPAGIVNHPGSVNDAYSVRIHGFSQINKLFQTSFLEERTNRRRYFETPNGFYYPIQIIEQVPYSGMVYDFTAEGLTMLSPFVTLDCVTHWSQLDIHWKGVQWSELVKIVKPKPNWTHLIQESGDGYSTNVPREDLERGNVVLVYELDGKPIPREHGWPMRIMIPHLYGWKSAKFLKGLRFQDHDTPGFWEVRGYHNHGDALKEERYG